MLELSSSGFPSPLRGKTPMPSDCPVFCFWFCYGAIFGRAEDGGKCIKGSQRDLGRCGKNISRGPGVGKWDMDSDAVIKEVPQLFAMKSLLLTEKSFGTNSETYHRFTNGVLPLCRF